MLQSFPFAPFACLCCLHDTDLEPTHGVSDSPPVNGVPVNGVAVLRRFAQSLQRDYTVVKAGFTLPWGTNPVEGHSNRLKLVKRQMFGAVRLRFAPSREQ
jgi:hypothetical protein